MNCKFRISTTFTLESRKSFVIAGEVIEGNVSAEMSIKTTEGRVLIKSIEISDNKNEALTSLLVQYTTDFENERFRNLFQKGITIEII